MNKHFLIILVVTLFLGLIPTSLLASNSQDRLPPRDSLSFLAGYPLAFYLPETRLGLAAAGIYTFRSNQNVINTASNIQVLLGYTLNRQLLIFTSYSIFRKENKHFFGGELGYYDYFYPYFGEGNDTRLTSTEDYFVKFPRLRSRYLFKNSRDFYLGPALHLEDYNIFQTEPNGILDNNISNGSNGSSVMGIGLSALADRRDIQFYPTQGYFLDASLHYYRGSYDSSQVDYLRFSMTYSHYLPVNDKCILALNLFQEIVGDSAPLQEKALFGGPKYARGYVIGRYRDNIQTVLQSELRFPLFWRLKGAAFLSVGNVADRFANLTQNVKVNYGVGLRAVISKTEQLNIRIDYGRSNEGGNFYVTIGEAF